jgi:hypothetical protein
MRQQARLRTDGWHRCGLRPRSGGHFTAGVASWRRGRLAGRSLCKERKEVLLDWGFGHSGGLV